MKIQFYDGTTTLLKDSERLVLVGSGSFFKDTKVLKSLMPGNGFELIHSGVSQLIAGNNGSVYRTYISGSHVKEVALVVLPEQVSRYNSPTKRHWIYQLTAGLVKGRPTSLIMALEEPAHMLGACAALFRHEGRTSYKSSDGKKKTGKSPDELKVMVINHSGKVLKVDEKVTATGDGVAWAASLVDQAPSELNPEAFSKQIKAHFRGVPNVKISEFVGEDLIPMGLRGLYAVGKGAHKPARMVVLHYKPREAKKCIALVGKGLTYDTGGLSLKISGSMVGMKSDMGGAAAVLGAFHSLVQTQCKNEIIAVCGIVENAIGPDAYKNDDILFMHSGKTVEVNNTDAEGRIVLADALSWVVKNHQPKIVIDAATLTGAQLVSTGLLHAAIVSNDEKLEADAVKVGKLTGDLVHPLIFAPELFQDEFKSSIADMKNSVKNRNNSQSSCAAQFLWSHISDAKNIRWLHIDLAGPATGMDQRGTGFGVALISELARH